MSLFSIKQYQSEVEKIIHYGGTKKETAIRNAFYNLLNEYAKGRGLMIVPEVSIKSTIPGKTVTPDGTLKDTLRQDWGYWESKDESDVLDDEIKKKFAKGYPKENILFEDSQHFVLIQSGIEVKRTSIKDPDGLHALLSTFINFERPEISNFRKAIELFKQDIPKVTETLRAIILEAETNNPKYTKASKAFLKLCHDSINPEVTKDDVREMIIQHILTEDVFNTIFDETQFHRENNIAHQLEQVIQTFFTGTIRRTALASIQHYYQAINAAGAGIADHHEKQKFLKIIYETFYKSYNPKAADRLGVVYTPNEIVQFMIKGTDYLLHKYFNKFLEDKGVEILDPATGTGTFICDIIDYIGKDKLEYKYKNEMHANEVAILPYYISNLNIEFTYTQKMGAYSEFENLCFVDTLDNMGFLFHGKQIDMFSPFTEENSKRIKKQNSRKIAVVIGNPPYNANQQSENDNNKNREYPDIDQRIKDTYIKYSTAQKTKVYDMYARFYRWAMDRLDNNGIIAFVTNRSFIESRTFDGFRKCVQNDFDFAYIVDTKSDVRANPKIAGTTHNVFGIQTGVAIMFLVRNAKRDKKAQCNIQYISMPDEWRKEVKLQWLNENPLKNIDFTHIRPDKNNNWINLSDNDFESLLPLNETKGLFKKAFMGISTNRDEWVYDLSENQLAQKMKYFTTIFNASKITETTIDERIKWSRDLRTKKLNGKQTKFESEKITALMYRPFFKQYFYADKVLIDRYTQNHIDTLGENFSFTNKTIAINYSSSKDFNVLAIDKVCDLHFNGDTNCINLYSYDSEGNRMENITDWGLNQFTKQYGTKKITKEDVFNYTYAVLHSPAYRTKYELNLKREFPRIPFYEDFKRWAAWGKALMDLHINYESVEPYKLIQTDTDFDLVEPSKYELLQKGKLKADKEAGKIIIDGFTTLSGIPPEAWQYKLGNRSALEWVLDQYKEGKPKDPTIAEKFDTYRFADYKAQVIDLLKRVCTVSVKTQSIIEEMKTAN
jgi:predicted helicase